VSDRVWIVGLHVRSAVRLADDKLLNIRAGPESTVSVVGVRLRNLRCVDEDGSHFFAALVAEAAGHFPDAETAVSVLGNLASPYLQVAALACNTAIDEVEDVFCYSPPVDADDTGTFLIQRHSQPRAPAAVVRDLPVPALFELLQALHGHEREDRLHRAMAHYRLALDHIAFQNWVLASEYLYIAVENLARVVTQRLINQAGFPDNGEGKHKFAISVGFTPANERDRSHLGRLDSWVREQHVFARDVECYRQLVDASDAFEHGYEGFDYVRERAKAVTRRAFSHVRKAILTEIGLPQDSELFDSRFDVPLGDWRPVLELEGTYKDSAPTAIPDFENPKAVNDGWPDFVGPTVIPLISKIVDHKDGKRQVSLTARGDGRSLTESQSISIIDTRWVVPSGKEVEPPGDIELTQVLLNGNDVTEQYREASIDTGAPTEE
jgi:hypothetical protein